MQAIVLAAGAGTRMGSLTRDKPKALVKLGAKPLLEHVIESLERAGVTETVIVTGKFGNQTENFFGNRFKKMKLVYAKQQKPLGTANALESTKTLAQNEFLMGHCDVIPPSNVWKNLMKTKGFDCVMTLRKEEQPEKFGVVVTDGGLAADIIEKPENPPSNLVNAGCYKFSNKVFDAISKIKPSPRGELELTDAIKLLMKQKKAGFLLEKKKIWDIGNPEELADAAEAIGEEEIKW